MAERGSSHVLQPLFCVSWREEEILGFLEPYKKEKIETEKEDWKISKKKRHKKKEEEKGAEKKKEKKKRKKERERTETKKGIEVQSSETK